MRRPFALPVYAVMVLACAPSPNLVVSQPGTDDTTTGSVTEPVAADTIEVPGVPREFRGVWVATVYNLDHPSSTSLSADAQKAELTDILDMAAELGLNAVLYQVRPTGGALYDSALEPWSRWLTGVEGNDPGYDPLQFALTEAHARGLELHAWINPYRAGVSSSPAHGQGHMALRFPEHTHTYDGQQWMDPGAAVVREHVRAVVADLLDSYAVDGLHVDDYVYPYPDGSTEFPDTLTWSAYQNAGGTLSRDDWRRQNVHDLVEGLHQTVLTHRPSARLSISPFGIYRPGQPEGVVGLDQFEALFSDPLVWADAGWVDDLGPQLYWPTTSSGQPFEALAQWWRDTLPDTIHVSPGLIPSNVGSSSAWTPQELVTQITVLREVGAQGHIHFRAEALLTNQAGLRTALAPLYVEPTLTQPLVRGQQPGPPVVTAAGDEIRIEAKDRRALVLYEGSNDGTWELSTILPGTTTAWTPQDGVWALSQVNAFGLESDGVLLPLPSGN
ncbi:MAG: glycoside hydrolase family 10 protein [Myxococcota bacterium]